MPCFLPATPPCPINTEILHKSILIISSLSLQGGRTNHKHNTEGWSNSITNKLLSLFALSAFHSLCQQISRMKIHPLEPTFHCRGNYCACVKQKSRSGDRSKFLSLNTLIPESLLLFASWDGEERNCLVLCAQAEKGFLQSGWCTYIFEADK